MRLAVGADDNTAVVQRTNKGGKTTLVQDPSNYYTSQGAKNLNPTPTYSNTTSSTRSTSSTPSYNNDLVFFTSGDDDYGYDDFGYDDYYEEPEFDWAAYYEELERQERERQEELLRQQQERADEAYYRNMERIGNAYGSMSDRLSSNYSSTADRLNAAKSDSMSDVNSDAEKALREAYINNMLTKRNLNQRLSAMGYNGGATESTLASLENNYGNSRNNINNTLNTNIRKLNSSYGDNLAAALESYNSALNNLDLTRLELENEAEARRQNADDSYYSNLANLNTMDSSYLQALQQALADQAAYTYKKTQATNNYVAGNARQAASATKGNNYAKYLQQAQLAASQGHSKQAIKNALFNEVYNGNLDINYLDSILSQLSGS